MTLDSVFNDYIKARSNYAKRVLRAVFNFAVHEYQLENGQPIISVNPVEHLLHTRSWFRVDSFNGIQVIPITLRSCQPFENSQE